MKSRFTPVLAVLGLVACGDSTDVPEPAPSEADAVITSTAAPMRQPVSPEELAALRAREPSRSARALAEVERCFASRTPGLTFRVRRVLTDRLGDTHVWIQQLFQGTPVEGRDLGVIVFVDDRLRVLGEPDAFEGVAPARLSATEGLKRARAHVARKGLAVEDTVELILEPVHERRLRPGATGDNAADYETRVVGFERGARVRVTSAFAPDEPRELFVRERDGAVLERAFPPAALAPATLRSYFAGNVTLPTEVDSRGNYYLESARGDVVSAATQPGGPVAFNYTSRVNTWGDNQLYAFQGPNTVNGQTAAADAFISIYGTRRMFEDVYVRNSWDDLGGRIQAYVHLPQGNAYPQGNGVVSLGYQPNGTGYTNIPMTDIETVAHEVSHMTFQQMTGLVTSTTGELGGLNEGTADIFGLVAGFYLPDALATSGPCTGLTCGSGGSRSITVRNDWVYGNQGGTKYGRSFIDPFQFPAWGPGITTAFSHYAAGPLERMFYFLSVGVLPAGQAPVAGLLNPQRESPYLPEGLTGLGINTANQLWYRTLHGVYFSRVTNYLTARDMMLEATADLYGSKPHTPQYKAVEDAWAAVNVGPPADRTPPAISITTLQKSPTEAVVTVDITDANGVFDGKVSVVSAAIPGVGTTQPCTGHCVITIDPRQYGSHEYHYVKVWAQDTRENATEKRSSFTLDVTRPIVTITSTSSSPMAPRQNYKYSGYDTLSGVASAKVFVDGVQVVDQSWTPSPGVVFTIDPVSVDVTARADGWYPVRFETADRYGNTRVDEYSLLMDRAPPDLCSLSVAVDPANNGRVTLTLTGRDALVGLSALSVYHTVGGLPLGVDSTDVGSGVQRTLSQTVTLASGTYSFFGVCTDQRANSTTTPSQPTTVTVACNTMAVAGGAQVDERTFQMGKASGTVTLSYHTYGVHDRIKVYSDTSLVADTGCVATGYPSTLQTRTFAYAGTTGLLKVRVEPNCDPVTAASTTEWEYVLSCP